MAFTQANCYLFSFFYLLVVVAFLWAILSFLILGLRIGLQQSNNANRRTKKCSLEV